MLHLLGIDEGNVYNDKEIFQMKCRAQFSLEHEAVGAGLDYTVHLSAPIKWPPNISQQSKGIDSGRCGFHLLLATVHSPLACLYTHSCPPLSRPSLHDLVQSQS